MAMPEVHEESKDRYGPIQTADVSELQATDAGLAEAMTKIEPLPYGHYVLTLDHKGVRGRGEQAEADSTIEKMRRCLCEIGRHDMAFWISLGDDGIIDHKGLLERFNDNDSALLYGRALRVVRGFQYVYDDEMDRMDGTSDIDERPGQYRKVVG